MVFVVLALNLWLLGKDCILFFRLLIWNIRFTFCMIWTVLILPGLCNIAFLISSCGDLLYACCWLVVRKLEIRCFGFICFTIIQFATMGKRVFFSLMKNISLYALCQLSLIFLYLLPNRVSEVLWSQFSTFTIDQWNRAARLLCLIYDKLAPHPRFLFEEGSQYYYLDSLVEDTLWTGIPGDYTNPNAPAALLEVRKLVDNGQYAEATTAAEKLSGNQSDVCIILRCHLFRSFYSPTSKLLAIYRFVKLIIRLMSTRHSKQLIWNPSCFKCW